MTPDTQIVYMVKRLTIDPKPLKTKNNLWYALLKLENRVQQKDGSWKHGPAFTVILKGLAAQPSAPIYTAKKGCVVCVAGQLSSIWTKRGVSTVIESGWVNIILHPGAALHMKFRGSESTPPMNTAIDLSEGLEMLAPDNSQGALADYLAELGTQSMETEKEFTENLMSEVLMKRLQNEGMRSISRKTSVTGRRNRVIKEGEVA